MIHAYLTDGFFPMAKVFLKSLLKTNGDKYQVVLSTRNLTISQLQELYAIYPTVSIDNVDLDYDLLAKRAEVDLPTLLKYKREVESDFVTVDNRVWKLMIAAEDRVRSLHKVLTNYLFDGPILHLDIDTLIRRDLSEGFDIASKYDLCLLLRPNFKAIKGKITISTIGLRLTEPVLHFFRRWFYWLDKVPPAQRPIGYGQTSCWLAYQDCKNKLNVHTFDQKWGYPGKSNNGLQNFVWSGAIHKLTKDDCVKQFNECLRGL